MDAQPSIENQVPQSQSAAPEAKPVDPRVSEVSNQLRVIKNIAQIIDGFEIKGVQTAKALLEASTFVQSLHDQVVAQLAVLTKEPTNAETPKTN